MSTLTSLPMYHTQPALTPGRPPKVMNTTGSTYTSNVNANGSQRVASVANVNSTGIASKHTAKTSSESRVNERTSNATNNNILPHVPSRPSSATQSKLFCTSRPVSGSASNVLPSTNMLTNTSRNLTPTLSNTFCHTPLTASRLTMEAMQNDNDNNDDATSKQVTEYTLTLEEERQRSSPYSNNYYLSSTPLYSLNTQDKIEIQLGNKLLNIRPRPLSSMTSECSSLYTGDDATNKPNNSNNNNNNKVIDMHEIHDIDRKENRTQEEESLYEQESTNAGSNTERPCNRYGVRLTVSPAAGPWTLRRLQGRVQQARVQAEQFHNYAKAIEMLISVQMGLQATSSAKHASMEHNTTLAHHTEKRKKRQMAEEYMTPEQLIRHVGVIGREIQYVTALWVEALQCTELLSASAYNEEVNECRRRSAELITKFKAEQEAIRAAADLAATGNNKNSNDKYLPSLETAEPTKLTPNWSSVHGQHIRVSIGEYVDHSHSITPYRKVMRAENGEEYHALDSEEEQQQQEQQQQQQQEEQENDNANAQISNEVQAKEEESQEWKEEDQRNKSNTMQQEEANKNNDGQQEILQEKAEEVDEAAFAPNQAADANERSISSKEVLVQFEVFENSPDAKINTSFGHNGQNEGDAAAATEAENELSQLSKNHPSEQEDASRELAFAPHQPSDYEDKDADDSHVLTQTEEPPYSSEGPRFSRSTSIAEQRRKSKLNARRHIPRVVPKVDCPSNNSSLVGELAPGLDDEILGQGNGLNPFDQGIKYASMNFRSAALESGALSSNWSRQKDGASGNTLTHDSELDFLLRKHNDQAASLDAVVVGGLNSTHNSPNVDNVQHDFVQIDAMPSEIQKEVDAESAINVYSNDNNVDNKDKDRKNDGQGSLPDVLANEINVIDKTSLNNTKNALGSTKIYKDNYNNDSKEKHDDIIKPDANSDREVLHDERELDVNKKDNDFVFMPSSSHKTQIMESREPETSQQLYYMQKESQQNDNDVDDDNSNTVAAHKDASAASENNDNNPGEKMDEKEVKNKDNIIDTQGTNATESEYTLHTSEHADDAGKQNEVNIANEQQYEKIDNNNIVDSIDNSSQYEDDKAKMMQTNTVERSEEMEIHNSEPEEQKLQDNLIKLHNVSDSDPDDNINANSPCKRTSLEICDNEADTSLPEQESHEKWTNHNEEAIESNSSTLPVALQSLTKFDNLPDKVNDNYHALRQPFTYSSEVIAQKFSNKAEEADEKISNTSSNNSSSSSNSSRKNSVDIDNAISCTVPVTKAIASAESELERQDDDIIQIEPIDEFTQMTSNEPEHHAKVEIATSAIPISNANGKPCMKYDKNILHQNKIKAHPLHNDLTNTASPSQHSASSMSTFVNCYYGFPPSFGPGTETYRPIHAAGYIDAHDSEHQQTRWQGSALSSQTSRESNFSELHHYRDEHVQRQRKNRLYKEQNWYNANGEKLRSPLTWLRESKRANTNKESEHNELQTHTLNVNIVNGNRQWKDSKGNKNDEAINTQATWPV